MELKPFWRKWFSFNWKFALFLLVLVCIPRFILVLHANMTGSYGAIGAVMLLSALAPFIVYLSHFGLLYIGGTWFFPMVPALIWIWSMFFVSLLFGLCRRKSGSILGSIICHAGFNLGMIYCIFYLL